MAMHYNLLTTTIIYLHRRGIPILAFLLLAKGCRVHDLRSFRSSHHQFFMIQKNAFGIVFLAFTTKACINQISTQ